MTYYDTSKRFNSPASAALFCFAGALLINTGNPHAKSLSGYQTTAIDAKHRNVTLPLHIWYPSGDGKVVEIGKNAVFTGTKVSMGTPVPDQSLPLIVLSHGSGGNAANLGWIAGHLAQQGNIVVAPNHPNTTSGNSLPHETVKIWERPQDVSAILDYFEKNAPFGLKPDMSKAGIIGFSLGGHTAMAVSGTRADRSAYIDYCDQNAKLWDCKWFSDAKVDLTKVDKSKYEQNLRDERISFAVVIDPALAQAYQRDSLKAMKLPVQIINLGTEQVPLGIDASGFVDAIPNAEYHSIEKAGHFSFLGECTVMGPAIISSVGEDPICTETSERSRRNIHVELKALIGGFVKRYTRGASMN